MLVKAQPLSEEGCDDERLIRKAVRLLKSRVAQARDSGQEARNDVQPRIKTDPNIKSQERA
jgi:hypothetical protein